MEFQTKCVIEKPLFSINYSEYFIGLGSCFVDNIGSEMLNIGLRGSVNPLGIMYNPISIANAFDIARGKKTIQEGAFFLSKGTFRHWDIHGQWSDSDRNTTFTTVQNIIEKNKQVFNRSSVFLISLGTSYAWKRKGRVVANCHQMPQSQFKRELLDVTEIRLHLEQMLNGYLTESNQRKVILTVSPVRYLRDGLIDNNRSKARLLEVVHQIADHTERVSYFPAYEIVNDELRDYRFFKEDMVHPSKVAVEYVWNKFQEAFFDEETKSYCKASQQIQKMRDHRIQNPNSMESKKFKEKIQHKQRELEKRFPFSF